MYLLEEIYKSLKSEETKNLNASLLPCKLSHTALQAGLDAGPRKGNVSRTVPNVGWNLHNQTDNDQNSAFQNQS